MNVSVFKILENQVLEVLSSSNLIAKEPMEILTLKLKQLRQNTKWKRLRSTLYLLDTGGGFLGSISDARTRRVFDKKIIAHTCYIRSDQINDTPLLIGKIKGINLARHTVEVRCVLSSLLCIWPDPVEALIREAENNSQKTS